MTQTGSQGPQTGSPQIGDPQTDSAQEVQTVLVHIGKCGGSTLRQALEDSASGVDLVTHVRQPPIGPQYRYYITLRCPLRRAISAFYWRRKLVLREASQATRFPGEAQILAHYVSLDNLARVLFHKDGSVNAMVQGQFRALHHLGEGISFYLQDLLAAVQPDQILGVLLQEQLEADLLRLFGLCSPGRLNDNSQPDLHPAHSEDRRLSLQAQNNLRRFLQADYACIKTLDAWGKLPAGYLQGLDEALPSPPQDGADGWRAWAKPRGHALFP